MSQLKTNVKIIGINEQGERLSAAAARISTKKGGAEEIFEGSFDTKKNKKLIQKVLASGHETILEHMVFNLAFNNVSAVVEQFMIEFRLASFMVKSRRYVDFSDAGFFVPEALDAAQKDTYRQHMEFLFREYQAFTENGIAKEDARFLLPYCFYSNFYCTVNARELVLILRRMLYENGSSIREIHDLGLALYSQLETTAPAVYAYIKKQLSDWQASEAQPAETAKQKVRNGTGMSGAHVELISRPNDTRLILDAAFEISGTYATVKSPRPRELEHLCYTFIFRNISLSGITHMVRHRMQSIIVPPIYSADLNAYVIPDSINEDAALLKRYKAAFATNALFADTLKEQGAMDADLVYLRLSGNVLDIMSTMNARELMLFFRLRTCFRAQWEIRALALSLLEKLKEVSPEIFNYMGPSCRYGNCPEGKLSCGNPWPCN